MEGELATSLSFVNQEGAVHCISKPGLSVAGLQPEAGTNLPNGIRMELTTVLQRLQLLGFNALRVPFSFTDLFTTDPRNFTDNCTHPTDAEVSWWNALLGELLRSLHLVKQILVMPLKHTDWWSQKPALQSPNYSAVPHKPSANSFTASSRNWAAAGGKHCAFHLKTYVRFQA